VGGSEGSWQTWPLFPAGCIWSACLHAIVQRPAQEQRVSFKGGVPSTHRQCIQAVQHTRCAVQPRTLLPVCKTHWSTGAPMRAAYLRPQMVAET